MKSWDRIGIVRIRVEQKPDDCFTIASEDMPGIFLAGNNLEKLINDVPGSIELIFDLNHGKRIKVGVVVPGDEMAKDNPRMIQDQMWAFTLMEP